MFSCKSDPGPEPRPVGPDYFIEKTASRDVTVGIIQALIGAGYPELAKLLEDVPSQKVGVDAITYNTIDPLGNPIVASGIISYPADIDIRGVIVALHGTILSDAEAPTSVMFQAESALSLLGYVVVMPDYIGFGASKSLPHPYLHAASSGRATVDMLLAAEEYMKSIGMSIGNPVSVVGYSQGGHTALAFEQVVEADYPDKIQIKTVYAGGGPYDLTGTCDHFVKTNTANFPCFIPYIAIGLNYGDNLKVDFSMVFIDRLLANYEKWYDKANTATKVNELIGTSTLKNFMHGDLFKPERNAEINKLYRSLAENSLLDWKPQAEVVLYHAENDTVVPPLNSDNAYDAFEKQGVDVEQNLFPGDHIDGMVKFYVDVFTRMKK